MTIFRNEMKQGAMSLLIWSAAISFMMALCIIIYPEMAKDMGDVSALFAGMGSFSAAFGMDRLNFGEFIGFFSVECGNILGLGGAFFAALAGISSLAREEKEHTAEFLLAHPVSRSTVITEKLLAVAAQTVVLNVVAIALTALSLAIIGEEPDVKRLALLFTAYFLMQLEIAAICCAISAFIHRRGTGIGLGLAAIFYFLNIVSNLTENARALKYLTPFGYTDSADIVSNCSLDAKYLAAGMVIAVIGIAIAYWKYTRKDIA